MHSGAGRSEFQNLALANRTRLFEVVYSRSPGRGETGDPRENPLTSGIVWSDSHLRKSGVNRPGIETGSPWWEASSLTAQPPCHLYENVFSQRHVANKQHHTARRVSCREGACTKGDETTWWLFGCGRTHSLIGCAKLWGWALCLTGYCELRDFPYWLGDQLASRLLHADWRTAGYFTSVFLSILWYTGGKTATVDSIVWSRGGMVVRLPASRIDEAGSIAGSTAPGFSLVRGFSRGSPVSPALAFLRLSILTSFHPHRLSRHPLHSVGPWID
ncbi:hypothetical protein PR048_031132 [Dryococelus australis]|uniref:Uncharacterized protein n=1 Tax=Dryococelus australis TaxID=614101 RepID=A0ABQ9G8H7_9NEOP|nr:hypothetical protein PR048_031132 [Dryococelus australis]